MKYIKKPVVIDAEVYKVGMEDGIDYVVKNFYGETKTVGTFIDMVKVEEEWKTEYIEVEVIMKPYIDTLEGKHYISSGDYIIIGVKGERYPCKPDIFAQTYDILD